MSVMLLLLQQIEVISRIGVDISTEERAGLIKKKTQMYIFSVAK